jgi:mono/diheme cytochrome c family protein
VFISSKFIVLSTLAVFTLLMLVACVEATENPVGTTTLVTENGSLAPATSESAASGPDIANGARQFKGLGCSGCHRTDSTKLVGPGLSGIGARGDDAIRTSIIDPSAIIVDGFNDLMPKTFGDVLSDSELDDLIGYLNTLN